MTAPEIWYIRGEGGGIIPMQLPLGEGIPARLRSGALVRVNPDGSLYTGPVVAAEPVSLAEQQADAEREVTAREMAPVDKPATTANKAAWVAYAVSAHGVAKSAADDLTKAELIARYGG